MADSWSQDGDQLSILTRNPDKADNFTKQGWDPIVGDLTQPASLPNQFPPCDTVLIAVGMDRTRYDDIFNVYVGGVEAILKRLHPDTQHIIYISSTGVFGNFDGEWVHEESPAEPTRDGGRACLQAEQRIWNSEFANRATVLRLSGIYGPGRIPSLKFVQQGEWDRLNPAGYLNLIHLDDIVAVVRATAVQRPFGETILVSDGDPPLREVYYEYLAELLQVPVKWPEQGNATPMIGRGSDKRVVNDKLKKLLGIELIHKNFRSGCPASI